MLTDDLDKIVLRTDFAGDCWLWTGRLSESGYGCGEFRTARTVRPHRVLWQLTVGPIPEGMELDHLCRNRACVNPDHLEVVTHRENSLRGSSQPAMNARKTHCKRGHPLQGDNVRIVNGGRSRRCVLCSRAAGRARPYDPEKRHKVYLRKKARAQDAQRLLERRARRG